MPLDLQGPELEGLIRALQDQPVIEQPAPPPADPPKIGKWPWIAMLAGQGGDAATTAYGISRHGLEEVNPVMGKGLPRILGTKAAANLGMAMLMKWAERTEEPKNVNAAKAAGYIMGGLGAAPAAWNAYQIAKHGK